MTQATKKPYNSRRMPCTMAPKLSYEDAMARYLITPDGIIFKVKTVHAPDFVRWIRAVVAFTSAEFQEMFHGLDYASTVDRWYALNLLLEHKIALPLFLTFDQAQAVLDDRK